MVDRGDEIWTSRTKTNDITNCLFEEEADLFTLKPDQ